jgi:hypothetical protein
MREQVTDNKGRPFRIRDHVPSIIDHIEWMMEHTEKQEMIEVCSLQVYLPENRCMAALSLRDVYLLVKAYKDAKQARDSAEESGQGPS